MPARDGALAANGPQLIAQVLLHERQFRLHGEHDVRQRGVGARRHGGQDPRGPLLIHQAARAVDRIDDDRPLDARDVGASRQHDFPARQALGDESHGCVPGDRPLDLLDQHVFRDAVDRVDRVALVVVRDVAQRVDGAALAGGDDIAADPRVQREERGKKRVHQLWTVL